MVELFTPKVITDGMHWLARHYFLCSLLKKAVDISAAQTSRLFIAVKTKAIRIVSKETTPEYVSSGGTSGSLWPPATS